MCLCPTVLRCCRHHEGGRHGHAIGSQISHSWNCCMCSRRCFLSTRHCKSSPAGKLVRRHVHVCVCVCVCVQIRKTKYVFLFCQQNAGQYDNTKMAYKAYQNVEKFKYLRKTLPNQNCMHKEIKSSLKSGNACYHSVRDILSSFLPSRSIKIKIQYMELHFCVFCMGVKLGPSHHKYVF